MDYPPHLLSGQCLKRFFCLVPVDTECHADNYTRLIKFLILLYIHNDKNVAHPLTAYASCESPHISYIMAESPAALDIDDLSSAQNLMSNIYLQPVDFNAVSMTQSGTVIFTKEQSRTGYTVIDQNSLKQGRVEVVTFKANGEISLQASVLPWCFAEIMSHHTGTGRPLSRLLDYNDYPFANPGFNRP